MPGDAGFWNRIAAQYAARPIADPDAYARKLDITRRYLHPGSEVFEFGCGTGGTARLHAPRVKHVLATDLSGEMLRIARERAAAEAVENIEFREGSIEAFEAPAGSFDVVLGMSILHLLRDWRGAIAKVHRLLKPGGVFISSTTCMEGPLRILQVIGPIGRAFGKLPYLSFFTQAQLVAELEKNGFVIEERWQPGPRKAVLIVARKPG